MAAPRRALIPALRGGEVERHPLAQPKRLGEVERGVGIAGFRRLAPDCDRPGGIARAPFVDRRRGVLCRQRRGERNRHDHTRQPDPPMN